MGLLSVPADPVPAWAQIYLHLHQPVRTWFGFGRLRCESCSEAWGRFGCWFRETAARVFVRTATAAQHAAALAAGRITRDDFHLRKPRPTRHRRAACKNTSSARSSASAIPLTSLVFPDTAQAAR